LIEYEVYKKVHGLGQKRNAGIAYTILAAISFKIVSLGDPQPEIFSN
jgi:hypothetical protein